MAPKTSLFPPNRQKIRRAEEARKNQIKTMGDLELTADMQSQFVGQMTQEQKDIIGGKNPEKSEFRKIFTYLDDPIAQYGFDPDRIRFEEPSKNRSYFEERRGDYPKNKTNAYYAAGEVYTDQGSESDIIKYGVKLGSSKEIIAHEARHRGFQLLRNMQLEGSQEDQEAWVKKYGREAAGLLDIYFSEDARHRFSAESINEIRDRPDRKFNPPKFDAEGNPAGMGIFSKGEKNPSIVGIPLEDLRESEKTGRIKFSGTFTDKDGKDIFNLSNEFINKAFQGLDQASKDAMKKQKDDYRKKMTVRSQEGKRKFAQGGLTSHPSAMTADQYYDSESDAIKQTKDVLGLESVPFFERPLDADDSDRIVGQDDAGNFVRQTVLGNKYTVARDPDQRTARTKIEEDVIPAVKKFADDPRFPTMDEVVGAGTAVAKGAYETASIPIDLLTSKRSPTSVQMGDAFDIAGGAAVGAGLQTLPDNAVGSMVGAFRRKDKPYLKKSIGINPDLDKTLSIKDTFSEEGIKEFYSIKNPSRSGYFYIANQIFDTVNIKDFMENVYSKLDTKSLTEPRFVQYFDAPSGEDIVKQYSDKLVLNVPKDIQDKTSDALSRSFTKLIDNLRYQQFSIDEDSKFRGTRAYDVYPVKDDIFVPTETELAFPSPRFEEEKNKSYSIPVQTITLGSPITPYVETMDIPKKGITGKNFLADIRKNLKVPVRVFQDDFIDGNKRYTREELLKLVEEKQFKVKAQEQGQYSNLQRQNEAGFTYGDEQEYFFMNIAATTGAGKITPRRQHASSDDIGHVRGSIITPTPQFGDITEFNDVTENKPILLAEEFQSDLYQKGYKTTNPDFMQQEIETSQYGRFSKEVQKIIADSSTAANKANIPAVNDYGYIKNNTLLLTNESIERTMIDAVNRGFIGGETFDSVSFSVDRPKNIETDTVFKDAYLNPERIEKTVRRFAEKGVSINLPETETFRAELFVPPTEFVPDVLSNKGSMKDVDYPQELEDYIAKTARSILKYREKITDEEDMIAFHFEKFVSKLDGTEVIPKQAKGFLRAAYKDLKRNTNDFQGLDAVTPPINKVKSVTDEMLKTLIVKAATSGVDKIVIPPTDRLAAVRFGDYKDYPPQFLAIMDKGLPASIQELKQSYPEVIVIRDVEMPYDNSMYPPGSNNIPSNQGTVIDLEAFFKKYNVSPEGEVRQFAQGGVAMKDQMEMSFALGGVAETVDPVSGNDVPPGSLPEEVRDDIPARLSEGEYVVPADVVRFFGVKFFEDIRMQAKIGLQQMDADGRIGGEPVEPQQAELSDDDLNSIIEQAMQQEQPMMANEGGVVGYKHGGYHPPDFLGMSVFGDKGDKEGTPYEFYDPDVGGYKPTTGDYGTTTPEAPTVTANAPDPVCPLGPNGERQRYDKSKGMCVPVSEGPTTEPEDPKPSVPFGSDFNDGKGVYWNDPKQVLKFAKTFDTGMISKDVRTGAGLATAFIPGAAPFAALGALGGKIDATQDVAGLKASRIISAALGQTENVKQIGGILEKYEKKFGDGFSGTFGIGTGFNNAASALGVERKDIKEFMEVYDDDDKSAEEKLKAQKTLEGLITNSKIIEENRRKKAEAELARLAAQRSAAQVAQQQAAARRNPNVIPGSGGGEGPDLLPSQVKSGYVSGNVRGLSNPQRAEIDRSSSKIDKQDADSFEDLNTGGLVQKRKKKK